MKIRVTCYSGHKSNERPLAFRLGDKNLEVREILDRWYGEHDDYFKVLADDGNTYVLKYRRDEDRWELASYTSPRLHRRLKEGSYHLDTQTDTKKKH